MHGILFKIGQQCQKYREYLGVTQKEVADEIDYSVEAISAFENGRTNNLIIFMWYYDNGFDFSSQPEIRRIRK